MMAILKQSNEVVVRENMKGGSGKASFYYVPIPDDEGAVKMASRIELEPGASIGFHQHIDDEEVYAILSGRGIFTDGTTEVEANPGDVFLTRKGESHSIKNNSDVPLIFFAMIAKKQQ
ncbi:Cupin domain-containing protein [Acetomicrobium thermoterrenum DSM 13490]|uniref:Cupin domain-containing protein n=2 Tax=Acetomicrobium TaxID=49894 RepID=A0A1H3HAA9_9BACT|nr:Cupin domain-containing protein [Acetomicrobium thermoterrenum DSM 13490]